MRTYTWWKSKKRRTQKKYTLFLHRYLSPKEVKEGYKNYQHGKGLYFVGIEKLWK